jgi:hypothetical protein
MLVYRTISIVLTAAACCYHSPVSDGETNIGECVCLFVLLKYLLQFKYSVVVSEKCLRRIFDPVHSCASRSLFAGSCITQVSCRSQNVMILASKKRPLGSSSPLFTNNNKTQRVQSINNHIFLKGDRFRLKCSHYQTSRSSRYRRIVVQTRSIQHWHCCYW